MDSIGTTYEMVGSTLVPLDYENPENLSANTYGNGTGPPYWSIPYRIIMATVLTLIMIVAIVGNAMVLSIIIRHRGMRTRTNMFLASLAVADLLAALLDMPFSLTTVIAGDWILGDHFCVFNGFTMSLFLITSIHTLMYISIHKFITITRPFSRVLTFRRVLIMISAAWLWAAFCATTTVTGLTSVEFKPHTTQCGPVYPNTTTSYIQSGIVTIGCYVIPLFIMTVSYIYMVKEIVGYSRRLQEHSNQEIDAIMRQQKRIILTLFIVVALFICCWTPYITYSMYAASTEDKDKIPDVLNGLVYWCGYLNSACNPIVYALRSPSFREGYREIFCQGPAFITDDMLGALGCQLPGDGRMLTLLQYYTLREESPNPLRRFSTFVRSSFRSSFSSKSRQSTSSFVGSLYGRPSATGAGVTVNLSRASLMKLLEQNGRTRSPVAGRTFVRSRSEPFTIMTPRKNSLPVYHPITIKEDDKETGGSQCDRSHGRQNGFFTQKVDAEVICENSSLLPTRSRDYCSSDTSDDDEEDLNRSVRFTLRSDCEEPRCSTEIGKVHAAKCHSRETLQMKSNDSKLFKSEENVLEDDDEPVFFSNRKPHKSLSESALDRYKKYADEKTSSENNRDNTGDNYNVKDQAQRTRSGPHRICEQRSKAEWATKRS